MRETVRLSDPHLPGSHHFRAPRRTEDCMHVTKNNFKILIVDDSPVSRKLVEFTFAQKRTGSLRENWPSSNETLREHRLIW